MDMTAFHRNAPRPIRHPRILFFQACSRAPVNQEQPISFTMRSKSGSNSMGLDNLLKVAHNRGTIYFGIAAAAVADSNCQDT